MVGFQRGVGSGVPVKQNVRWGAFVPQGWKREYAGWEAAAAWDRTLQVARMAEQLGFDHLWVYDHFETVPVREATHVFEAMTTLAALAQCTERIRLGQMVTCAAYRNAGLLAKELACIDVMSRGRVICGLGAGWYEREYAAYGFQFPSAGTRLSLLEETATVIRRLWTEETVTFRGDHLEFDAAFCDPKPLQQLPEIWIGGGGERVTLRIAAKHADRTNWQVGLEEFIHKSEVLRRHCDEVGRDFDSIVRTHAPDCRIFEDDRSLQEWLGSPGGGHLWGRDDPDDYVRNNFVGTAEQIAAKAQAFVDAGCREFVLWFRDAPETASMEQVARDVIPAVAG